MLSKNRRTSIVLVVTIAAIAAMTAASARGRGVSTDSVYRIPVAGLSGVPVDAAAVALQLTITNPTNAGYVTAYPCGSTPPKTSNLNFAAGEARSNMVLTAVGPGGDVCVTSDATADLVVDVMGSFDRSSPWATSPGKRVLDTRSKKFGVGTPAAGSVTRVALGVDATFAAVNITAVNARAAGYLTAFPCGTPVPQTTTVSFGAGGTTPSFALVPVTGGATCIFSSASADLVVDLAGWTQSQSGFEGRTRRLIDTRGMGEAVSLVAGAPLRVHTDAGQTGSTALLTVTTVDPQSAGYLTVYPCDQEQPSTSNNNFTSLEERTSFVVVEPGSSGDVCVFSSAPTDLVVDAAGSLTPPSGYSALPSTRIVDTRIGLVSTPTTVTTITTTSQPTTTTSQPTTTTSQPTTTTSQPTTTTSQPTTTTSQPTTTTSQPTTTTSQPTTTTTMVPPAASGGRPFAASSPWNTPTPASTSWFDTPVLHRLNRDGSFRHWWVNDQGVGVFYSKPGDPIWTFNLPDYVALYFNRNRPAQTFQVRAPANLIEGQNEDRILVAVDGTRYYEIWGAAVDPINRVVTCRPDQCGWATGDIVNGPGAGTVGNNDGVRASNFSWAAGLITGHDFAAGTIDHALVVSLNNETLKAGPNKDFVWPATAWDNGGAYGPIKMGSRLGIPHGTPRPAGLSSLGNMVFDALTKYGAFVGDYAGGDWPMFYVDKNTVTGTQVSQLFEFWNYGGSSDMEKIGPLLRIADYQP